MIMMVPGYTWYLISMYRIPRAPKTIIFQGQYPYFKGTENLFVRVLEAHGYY